MAPAPTAPSNKSASALRRKAKKTPLEDALAAGDPARPERLARWALEQWGSYYSALSTWRENRRRYAAEAEDCFKHRATDASRHDDESPTVFEQQNDSLNVVAGLAEFAAAQAEQDLFGGEPWFAATPEGKLDRELADDIQRHLTWKLRDGRMVGAYAAAIYRAAVMGEAFVLTRYATMVDTSESAVLALHQDGKPVLIEGKHVTDEQQAAELQLKGKLSWAEVYEQRDIVLADGVEVEILRHEDVAFREDAEELDLAFTNFYHLAEMRVLDAKERFRMSMEDALRLALVAGKDDQLSATESFEKQDSAAEDAPEVVFGDDEKEMLLNRRVKIVVGYVAVDPFGDGKNRRMCLAFPASGEHWLIWADYLANVSPKGELPVSVHVWEPVMNRLYGRGFFAKYASLQKQVDDLWNQVGFRNRMHANPVTGYHPEMLEQDEDDADLVLRPGLGLKLKADRKLSEAIEILALPDLDSRSMELMQVAIQLGQTRSGITAASQGDMSAVPENNTATGIRSLMSRAAVLLKKPVRGLRRSFTRAFSYAVKLLYANFDRQEAFVWGEGENAEMVQMTPEKVRDLEIDIRLLLTQEHNQTKLEGSQVAAGLHQQYVMLPELEKQAAHGLYLQAMKALEFEHPEEIIRKPLVSLEDAIAVLPPEEQQRFQQLVAMSQQAAQPLQGAPGQPTTPTTPTP